MQECVLGAVLYNNLPTREGLRWKPDDSTPGHEIWMRELPGDCFMFRGEARHDWLHGFRMPESASSQGNPHRRVSFTARFYRKECKQGKEGIRKWREAEEKMGQILYIQLIPGPEMLKDPLTARFDALLTVETQIGLDKMFKMISARCRLPKEKLSVCREGVGEVDPDSWPGIRDSYLAGKELSPVLPLIVAPTGCDTKI